MTRRRDAVRRRVRESDDAYGREGFADVAPVAPGEDRTGTGLECVESGTLGRAGRMNRRCRARALDPESGPRFVLILPDAVQGTASPDRLSAATLSTTTMLLDQA